MNKVELIGNVGKDPIVKQTKTGKKVMSFSLATSDSYTSNTSGVVQNTCWHRIVLWSNLAEQSAEIIKTGKRIYILGKINNRTWVDKDGQNRIISEVIGSVVEDRTSANGGGLL